MPVLYTVNGLNCGLVLRVHQILQRRRSDCNQQQLVNSTPRSTGRHAHLSIIATHAATSFRSISRAANARLNPQRRPVCAFHYRMSDKFKFRKYSLIIWCAFRVVIDARSQISEDVFISRSRPLLERWACRTVRTCFITAKRGDGLRASRPEYSLPLTNVYISPVTIWRMAEIPLTVVWPDELLRIT